jgi:uncharacterized membrane protein YqhA|tara:strand:- start:7240 stop:7455 length:216 start_codon:yes stop_codon:yes gene_type:complete
VDLNTFFFGLLIILSLVVFFYVGKFKASSKQRNREDKINWQSGRRFSGLKMIIWVMVSILGIALLARIFTG